jgi:chloride channel protein, CIC family
VLDAQGELYGVILFDDIRLFFTERNLPQQAVVAQDLLASNILTVHPGEDLMSTLRKFRETDQMELVVVDEKNPRHVVGILSRRDVLSTYQDRVQGRDA